MENELVMTSLNIMQFIDHESKSISKLHAEIAKQIAVHFGFEFDPEKTPPTPSNGEKISPDNKIVENAKTNETKRPGYITANSKSYPFIKKFRGDLKNNQTEAEKVMWECLRNKKTGHNIRRQHIIGNFITDFVCLPKKLIIEIDGKIHLKQKEYDELRTFRLNELGFEVIRFTNEQVFENPELVVSKIKEELDGKSDLIINSNTTTPPLEGLGEVLTPIKILDYIYAILHTPKYRAKYKDFFNIDLLELIHPKDNATFRQFAKLGEKLRKLHLLESPTAGEYITQYPINGKNVVTNPHFTPTLTGRDGLGKVYINETQYFDNVPKIAWDFSIGGYQPAQKWLNERNTRKLELEDILHFQKIIVALAETDKIMNEMIQIEIK